MGCAGPVAEEEVRLLEAPRLIESAACSTPYRRSRRRVIHSFLFGLGTCGRPTVCHRIDGTVIATSHLTCPTQGGPGGDRRNVRVMKTNTNGLVFVRDLRHCASPGAPGSTVRLYLVRHGPARNRGRLRGRCRRASCDIHCSLRRHVHGSRRSGRESGRRAVLRRRCECERLPRDSLGSPVGRIGPGAGRGKGVGLSPCGEGVREGVRVREATELVQERPSRPPKPALVAWRASEKHHDVAVDHSGVYDYRHVICTRCAFSSTGGLRANGGRASPPVVRGARAK